ncbi:hypothetical protein WN55_07107 [Dufourea novaeangliae]|uniref:Uncharacterized protein n=1 Tax=Dufourea novaeangliae TaxID=178035 RepID=A0A154P2C2_DUFNO|nr:hypothetical protein WN55_07107 [Dufourea novaeangliae]
MESQRVRGRREDSWKGLLKRSDSENDSKATCSRSFQLSVKVRPTGVRKPPANFFECPKPGVVIGPLPLPPSECPLYSYCDRISALFLSELLNVRSTFSLAGEYVSSSCFP